jgi:hypothetical protein
MVFNRSKDVNLGPHACLVRSAKDIVATTKENGAVPVKLNDGEILRSGEFS